MKEKINIEKKEVVLEKKKRKKRIIQSDSSDDAEDEVSVIDEPEITKVKKENDTEKLSDSESKENIDSKSPLKIKKEEPDLKIKKNITNFFGKLIFFSIKIFHSNFSRHKIKRSSKY